MSTSYNPKLFALNKIPPFDEQKFKMRKSKVMVVHETMDFEMLNIVEKGPHVPMY